MLDGFDEPPLKREKLSDYRLENKTYSVLESMNTKFCTTVNKTLNLNLPSQCNLKQLQEDSMSFHGMIRNIIKCYNEETNFGKKISLLTLLPNHWKFEQAKHYFQCSGYMFNKAKELKITVGKLKNGL